MSVRTPRPQRMQVDKLLPKSVLGHFVVLVVFLFVALWLTHFAVWTKGHPLGAAAFYVLRLGALGVVGAALLRGLALYVVKGVLSNPNNELLCLPVKKIVHPNRRLLQAQCSNLWRQLACKDQPNVQFFHLPAEILPNS